MDLEPEVPDHLGMEREPYGSDRPGVLTAALLGFVGSIALVCVICSLIRLGGC